MTVSYFLGRKYYPLPYQLGRMGLYILFAGALYYAGMYIDTILPAWLLYAVRVIFLCIYIGTVIIAERIPLPGIRRAKRQ